jgi:hypothetical protein
MSDFLDRELRIFLHTAAIVYININFYLFCVYARAIATKFNFRTTFPFSPIDRVSSLNSSFFPHTGLMPRIYRRLRRRWDSRISVMLMCVWVSIYAKTLFLPLWTTKTVNCEKLKRKEKSGWISTTTSTFTTECTKKINIFAAAYFLLL